MTSTTFYTTPSDLQRLIDELHTAESRHHIETSYVIMAPSRGACGRAAQMLLELDQSRWLARDDLAKANLEIERLRARLGHLPNVNELVEIAYKDDLKVRQVIKGDRSSSKTVVWRSCPVGQLWYVGVNDTPGFSIIGSYFIHTPEGFGTTWRFPSK